LRVRFSRARVRERDRWWLEEVGAAAAKVAAAAVNESPSSGSGIKLDEPDESDGVEHDGEDEEEDADDDEDDKDDDEKEGEVPARPCGTDDGVVGLEPDNEPKDEGYGDDEVSLPLLLLLLPLLLVLAERTMGETDDVDDEASAWCVRWRW